jgi:hypothetical protein
MGSQWGKKRTYDIESSNTGNWVTASRKEMGGGGKEGQGSESRKHLEASLLIYSLGKKDTDLPQKPKGKSGLADVRSVSWPHRKFIHSFIHFFPKV